MFYCYLTVKNDATSLSSSTKADIPPLCCHTSLCFSVKTPACWSINISAKKDDRTKYIHYRRREKTREGCLNLLSRAFVDKHLLPSSQGNSHGCRDTVSHSSDSLLCTGIALKQKRSRCQFQVGSGPCCVVVACHPCSWKVLSGFPSSSPSPC